MNEKKELLILGVNEAKDVLKSSWGRFKYLPSLLGVGQFFAELFFVLLGLVVMLVAIGYQKIKTGS